MLSFKIDFNKSSRKYKSGDVITCVVEFRVTEVLHVNSLSIRFKGAAHTEWTAKRSNLVPWQAYHGKETFTGDQLYFDSLKECFNQERDYVSFVLYKYTVRYTLPSNLPPR